MAKKAQKQAKNGESVAFGVRLAKPRFRTLKALADKETRSVSYIVGLALEKYGV